MLAPSVSSPLLALDSMDADRERIESAMHEAVRTPDRYLNEIASHLIVAGGKRLRPVVAVAAAQVHGAAASYDVVRGGVALRTRPPRIALPRRRDGRGRHPARRRDGEREVGGICRRSWPATSCSPGRPRSRRRWAPRSPASSPARSGGCAKARSRNSATPMTSPATRRATSPRSRARRPRSTAPRRASGRSSPATTVS